MSSRTRTPLCHLLPVIALALATVCAAASSGCGSNSATLRSGPMTTHQPTIELLGFPDCPNTPVMRANLAAALASIGLGWTFQETNQEQLPESDIRRGYPTPTVLLGGRDVFGLPVPTVASMGCRIYPGGVPNANVLADKLKAAAKAQP